MALILYGFINFNRTYKILHSLHFEHSSFWPSAQEKWSTAWAMHVCSLFVYFILYALPLEHTLCSIRVGSVLASNLNHTENSRQLKQSSQGILKGELYDN
jgi:hypothetical protein